MTKSASEALAILRDGNQFQWYIIPLFAIVVYIYFNEIGKRNWKPIFAGLAFWGMDWFNEIWNSLVFHFNGYAPVWGAPGKTAYLILVGLNIEICFMFAIAGLAFSKILPAEKSLRILNVPNRIFIAVAGALFCVIVEIWLNSIGALTWDYSWWNADSPTLIFLFGYLHFFLISFWIHDMQSIKNQLFALGIIYGIDLFAVGIFGLVLNWI